jgi:hypothetical protein
MTERKTFWHGSTVMIDNFGPAAAEKGVHFGSREQACMRNSAFLHEVALDLSSTHRTKDRQSWLGIAQRARRQGYDAVIYLNRYEGMTTERLTALLDAGHGNRLDTMSDISFKRLVPECEDSLLVVNPEVIRILKVFDRDGRVVLDLDAGENTSPMP